MWFTPFSTTPPTVLETNYLDFAWDDVFKGKGALKILEPLFLPNISTPNSRTVSCCAIIRYVLTRVWNSFNKAFAQGQIWRRIQQLLLILLLLQLRLPLRPHPSAPEIERRWRGDNSVELSSSKLPKCNRQQHHPAWVPSEPALSWSFCYK